MEEDNSLSHIAWLRSLLIIFTLAGILIIVANHVLSSQQLTIKAEIIKKINLKNIDDMLIGSEPPKLIYGDKSKVIFDANGIFVFDLKKQKIVQTFDTTSVDQGEQCSCMATKDGKILIFNFCTHYIFSKAYQYSFDDDSFMELSKDSWDKYYDMAYQCEMLPCNDIRFKDASGGSIAKLSDEEYFYLTFSQQKVNTLQIIHVNGKKQTVYKVFEPNT